MEAAQTRKAHRQAATCHRLAARLAASQPPVTESLSEWAILLSECHWGGGARRSCNNQVIECLELLHSGSTREPEECQVATQFRTFSRV